MSLVSECVVIFEKKQVGERDRLVADIVKSIGRAALRSDGLAPTLLDQCGAVTPVACYMFA